MSNELRWSGEAAEVRWAWHQAAALGPWTLTPREGGGQVVTASVVSADEGRMTQQPLTFVVPRGDDRPAWKWPIVAWARTGQTLIATLGPQED